MIDAPALLRIIRELDLGKDNSGALDQTGVSYLEVRRWTGDDNVQDGAATAILRQLVREKLGTFTLDAIGVATLHEIDTRSAA